MIFGVHILDGSLRQFAFSLNGDFLNNKKFPFWDKTMKTFWEGYFYKNWPFMKTKNFFDSFWLKEQTNAALINVYLV